MTTDTATSPAESDPFFKLLTEALRAGPGSAQWGEAVAQLRDGGVQGADEYKLILRAREDIELGRDYRKVSAGPGFTRKVLDAVEREGARRQGLPTATIVAILAGMVILGVIVTVIVIMSRGGEKSDPAQAAIAQLEAANLPVSAASLAVAGEKPRDGEGFKVFDATPFHIGTSTQPAEFTVAGVMTAVGLDPAVPGSVEAELVLPGNEAGAIEVLVSDSAEIRPETTPFAGPPSEIVWHYQDGRSVVYASGQQRGGDSTTSQTPGQTVKVAIRFDGHTAVITVNGRRAYAGPHTLHEGRPRFAGVRLFQPPSTAAQWSALKSVSVANAATAGGG